MILWKYIPRKVVMNRPIGRVIKIEYNSHMRPRQPGSLPYCITVTEMFP